MNQEKKSWREYWKSLQTFITDKQTLRRARISYGIIWNLLLILMIVILIGAGFAGGAGAGYFASLVKDEPVRSYKNMKEEIYNYEETSKLFFADNIYLGKMRTDLYREEVKLDDVSPYLINAVIATEDEYFYRHDGVVPKAILRAILQEATNSSSQSGGSTLTQQLIKNQILTNEVSFERKAKEILLALRLEKFFDKREILEAYLNVATFGRNASGKNIAGIQAAANGIFGKNAKDLTLPQAAFIAGLPQSPFGYTPFSSDHGKQKEDLSPGLMRMKTVLTRMKSGGYIDDKQYKEAMAYDITKDFVKKADDGNTIEKYPYLTFEIEKRATEILAKILAKKDGYDEKDFTKDQNLRKEYMNIADRNLRQSGYSIHTTINKNIYDRMQETAVNYPHYGNARPEQVRNQKTGKIETIMEPVELGATLIENKTGKILSFVGGRDFKREQVNHATDALRPNGSTMKPLLVYAPAMELGTLHPGSVLPDVEVYLNPNNPGVPWPKNYDLRYSGVTSVRQALTKSYNVPAVIAYKNILNQNPASFLEKMGFSSLKEDDFYYPAAALGSISSGVTVEENTNAFGTFANGGKFIDAYLIDKITDREGNVIYQHTIAPVDVFSPQTSFLTIDMMRDVINRGTATAVKSRLKFQSDWAGKTGTGHEYYDSWFVATNPNVSFGVWMGYDTPKSLERYYNGLTYGVRTNYLWADLMNAAYDAAPEIVDPPQSFQMPGGIVRRSYCMVSGLLPSDACSKAGLAASDYFIAKHAPSKVDDSLKASKFVTVGGKSYYALDSTPAEFVETGGVVLDPTYMESLIGHRISNPAQLLPQREDWSKKLVASAKLNDNGRTPAPPKLSAAGGKLQWGTHPEGDVVGYRIYRNGKKIASIKAGTSLSHAGGSGEYYITAVDVAGRESGPSNTVKAAEKQEKKKQSKDSGKKEKEVKKDTSSITQQKPQNR
ncbi:transglycosylase domain-containing protein [Bacillus massilinigeriensis]|uniref:transglycosylase domain-containing protein n=1 Tax=Bacillus mediterraneensis TaxID=1805474 RepID=UPI0008F863EC|nr:transglycosylase domain-containing protein [Bacillus mediterraneensis]